MEMKRSVIVAAVVAVFSLAVVKAFANNGVPLGTWPEGPGTCVVVVPATTVCAAPGDSCRIDDTTYGYGKLAGRCKKDGYVCYCARP